MIRDRMTRIVVSRRRPRVVRAPAEPSTSCRAEPSGAGLRRLRPAHREASRPDRGGAARSQGGGGGREGPGAPAQPGRRAAEPADQGDGQPAARPLPRGRRARGVHAQDVRRLPRRPRAPDARRAAAEQAQRRRFSTRSTPSSGAAVCTATGVAGEWTTGRRPSTSATNDAGRTSAGRWRRPPSVRSTGSSPGPWSAPCAGAGSPSARPAARNRLHRLHRSRRRPRRRRRRGCSRRRGRTRHGAPSSGSR